MATQEFASKGVAGTGLGLGIAGTALGLLNGGNCGGGLLGGLLGGNCGCAPRGAFAEVQYVSQLQAENASLKAENYADRVGKDVYAQSLNDNRALRTELYAFIKPLADEAAQNRVDVAVLKAQVEKDKEITALKIQNCCCETNNKIDKVASDAALGLTRLSDSLACLQNTVCRITQTVVPLSALSPRPCRSSTPGRPRRERPRR